MSTTNGNGNGGNGAREKRTLVEDGTEFKGTLSSSCPIVVMGKVEGDISGPSMEIAETGIVAGTVKVKELRSRGEIAGNVTADAVYLSGRVRDNTVIRAKTIEAHLSRGDGAMEVTFGVCELSIGDEPSRQPEVVAPKAIGTGVSASAAASSPPTIVIPAKEPADDAPSPVTTRSRSGTQPPPG